MSDENDCGSCGYVWGVGEGHEPGCPARAAQLEEDVAAGMAPDAGPYRTNDTLMLTRDEAIRIMHIFHGASVVAHEPESIAAFDRLEQFAGFAKRATDT